MMTTLWPCQMNDDICSLNNSFFFKFCRFDLIFWLLFVSIYVKLEIPYQMALYDFNNSLMITYSLIRLFFTDKVNLVSFISHYLIFFKAS